MTKQVTPEQMRALATALDAGVFRNEGLWPDEAQDVEDSIVALRAAADQLEAAQAWLNGQDSAEWDAVDLDALDSILDGDKR